MKFRKIVDDKNRIRTPASTGDKIAVVKGWIYKDGEYVFVPKKEHNHYEETQAARDSVDLKKILARYEAGDDSALDRVNGFYLDTVDIPHNLSEMYDAMSNANNVFQAMPTEVKEKYNNNPATFWKAYGSETFDNFLNDYRKAFIIGEDSIESGMVASAPVTPVKEVKVDEPEHE